MLPLTCRQAAMSTLSALLRHWISFCAGSLPKQVSETAQAGPTQLLRCPWQLQAAWQSRAAIAAAEAQSQQLAQAQAELNALKARLWDSAARNAELEKCDVGAKFIQFVQRPTCYRVLPPTSRSQTMQVSNDGCPCRNIQPIGVLDV